jgi:osmotically-inducible protein OsmY
MGWLQRIFNMGSKPEAASVNPAPATPDIPPAKVGLTGEFDESGLAKRVALAFDENPALEALDRLWVAQTGGTVVLKGEVPSQDLLNQAVAIANGVSGATDVKADQVTIG